MKADFGRRISEGGFRKVDFGGSHQLTQCVALKWLKDFSAVKYN